MHKMLYFGIGLLFGGGIGATTAYFLTKKRYEGYVDQEVEAMRQHYLKKFEEHFVTGTSVKDEKAATDAPVKVTTFPEEVEKPALEDIAKEKGYFNYANLAEEESPEEETGEGENLAHPADVYIITDEQYVTECLNYEKREFRYYIEDETLCNEEDEVLEPRYTVTNYAIEELLKEENELIYVRNNMLHIDYEVQKMFGSFREQVFGDYKEE